MFEAQLGPAGGHILSRVDEPEVAALSLASGVLEVGTGLLNTARLCSGFTGSTERINYSEEGGVAGTWYILE